MRKKQITRKSLAQLSIIVGQLTHLQPATFSGKKVYLLDAKIMNDWMESLREIIEEEVN